MSTDTNFVGNAIGALDDLRVVDLGSGMAPAIAGMFLADHGADVIKVEEPEGDWARSMAGFEVWNRNKRGAIVGPAAPSDVEWLATSVARAAGKGASAPPAAAADRCGGRPRPAARGPGS